MGLKLTCLMIFMHSILSPLPFSKGEVYKRDDLLSCKAKLKIVQFLGEKVLGTYIHGVLLNGS